MNTLNTHTPNINRFPVIIYWFIIRRATAVLLALKYEEIPRRCGRVHPNLPIRAKNFLKKKNVSPWKKIAL